MADIVPLLQLSLTALKAGTLPPTDVIKALISKGLGLGIIAGSTMIKVPQISNVLRARSAEGLSAAAFEVEAFGLLVTAAYGYVFNLPFSSYGEAAIMLAQNVVLLALIYKYARMPAGRATVVFAAIVAAIAAVASGNVSRVAMAKLYLINNFTLLLARLPQIAKNARDKSTGQLSIITYGVSTVGCVARIFTTLQEKAGATMLRSYILAFILNGTLVAQILLYGNKGVSKAPRGKPALTKKRA